MQVPGNDGLSSKHDLGLPPAASRATLLSRHAMTTISRRDFLKHTGAAIASTTMPTVLGPISASAPAERHPCVVVQSDLFNRSRIATTVVCLITSNLTRANAPGNVALPKGDGNLPKASVVNVSQVLTIDKSELVECTGELSGPAVGAVRDGLHLLFDRL